MLTELQPRSGIAAQLFHFEVPGLPEQTLAVSLQEVLEVSQSPDTLMTVPFTPSFVRGIGDRRGDVMTVIDMAAALTDSKFSAPEQVDLLNLHYLVTQVVVDDKMDVVAWPILIGASAYPAPFRASVTETPADFRPEGIFATIELAGKSVVVLNLSELATHITNTEIAPIVE